MRNIVLHSRLLVVAVLFAAVAGLTGCPDRVAVSHSYSGPLSANYQNRVLEHYNVDVSSGDTLLFNALMDTDNDGVLDIEVSLRGNLITAIQEVNLQDNSAKYPSELVRDQRPDNVQPPKTLLDIAALLAERPAQADLDAYARGRPSQDAAWRLAVKLRRCTDDILRIRIIQAAELSLNNNDARAEPSAFILAGLGPTGIEALGRVLVKTVAAPQNLPADSVAAPAEGATPAAQRIAETVTSALAVTPVSTVPAHDAIREFLIRNRYWDSSRNNIYRLLSREYERSLNDFHEYFANDVEAVCKQRPDLKVELGSRLLLFSGDRYNRSRAALPLAPAARPAAPAPNSYSDPYSDPSSTLPAYER